MGFKAALAYLHECTFCRTGYTLHSSSRAGFVIKHLVASSADPACLMAILVRIDVAQNRTWNSERASAFPLVTIRRSLLQADGLAC